MLFPHLRVLSPCHRAETQAGAEPGPAPPGLTGLKLSFRQARVTIVSYTSSSCPDCRLEFGAIWGLYFFT